LKTCQSTCHATIARRIVRLGSGLFGDAKSVGSSVSKLRIDYGPGYCIYFTRRKNIVVILLCGGTKSTQRRDIDLAKKLAAGLEDENGQN
jgi:putative addiction module killer protein